MLRNFISIADFFPTHYSICAIKLTSHKFIYISCIYGEGMMWLLLWVYWSHSCDIITTPTPLTHIPHVLILMIFFFRLVVVVVVDFWSQRWENMMKASVHMLKERKALFIMQSINNNNYTFHHRNSPFYPSCFNKWKMNEKFAIGSVIAIRRDFFFL